MTRPKYQVFRGTAHDLQPIYRLVDDLGNTVEIFESRDEAMLEADELNNECPYTPTDNEEECPVCLGTGKISKY